AIARVFAPAMEVFRTERGTGFDRPEPTLPINVFRGGFRVNVVIPFATDIVAAIEALAPHQRADFAAFDHFGAFVPAFRRASLRTDLKDFARFFDRVVDLEGLVQIASEWLLAIDMFACLHGIHG